MTKTPSAVADDFEDLGPAVDWLREMEARKEVGTTALEGETSTDEADSSRRKWRRTVGYLRGRGGPQTVTPGDALAALDAEARLIREGLEGLLRDLRRIELAFFVVEQAFRRTQPPMFKRLHVRWWRLKTGGRRVPVLVQVNGTKARSSILQQVKDRRVRLRQDGSFALCADINREVFETYWTLWALRKEAQEALSGVAASLRGWGRKPAGAVERQAHAAARLEAEATERLRRMGFEFEERVAPCWPLPEDFWEGLEGRVAAVVEGMLGREDGLPEGVAGAEDGEDGYEDDVDLVG